MNTGKTLFAQLMEFVPWKTFSRIVVRHNGDTGTRRLTTAELFRILAFSQLTWRESLRDIEACLAANAPKLFHMGLRSAPARSTLADALNGRDWRIYHALAMRLIARARALYADQRILDDLNAAVYALDSTTIDLCLSLFDWAPFRSTKAAIKLHTLLDLRGAIPAFIHISNGKMHDVRVLDILPIERGSIYVMDRGYIDYKRLFALHQAGAFFVTRAKETMDARQRLLLALRSRRRHHLRSARAAQRLLRPKALPRAPAPHSLSRSGDRKNADLSHQQHGARRSHHLCAL